VNLGGPTVICFLSAAVLVAAIGAWFDWRTSHIPNRLTLVCAVAAIAAHGVVGLFSAGAPGAIGSALGAVLGAVVCMTVPGVIFALGGMGGGDVKLFAAIGALCGVGDGLRAESYSLMAALAVAPAYLAYKGTLMRTLGQALTLVVNPFRPARARKAMPAELMTWFRLGPAIFVGTAAMFLGRVAAEGAAARHLGGHLP
jgi:prepilin peptidase CpaA